MYGTASIPPAELLAISILIGLILISILDYDQMNVIANVLMGIGGLLTIVSSQGILIKGNLEEATRNEYLKKQIALLREQLS